MSLEKYLPNITEGGKNNQEVKKTSPKNKQEVKSLGKKVFPYLAALLTVSPGLKTIAQEKNPDNTKGNKNIEYVVKSPAGKDTTFTNFEEAEKFIKDKNLMIKEKEETSKKYEVYGEKITDKELQNSAASFDEIREKYINREIRAYESVVVNSRFKKLRANEFAKSTQEESIQYGEKTVTVRLFKEGQGKELIKYLKKAYGVAEANRIIKEWGIDENSYETLLNLKRDQFVRGVVHGQDKEHSRWVYLAGGPGNTGTPFVGVVTEKDIFLEGLAECSGNAVFERVSVSCEDIELHNSNAK